MYFIPGMLILYSVLQKNVDVIPGITNNPCTLFRLRIIRYSLYLILAKHCTLLLASRLYLIAIIFSLEYRSSKEDSKSAIRDISSMRLTVLVLIISLFSSISDLFNDCSFKYETSF